MARPLISKLEKLSSTGSILAGGVAGGGLALHKALDREHGFKVQEDRVLMNPNIPKDMADKLRSQSKKDRLKRLAKHTAIGTVAGVGVGYGAGKASKALKGHLEHARTTVNEAKGAAKSFEAGVNKADNLKKSVSGALSKFNPKTWFRKNKK